MKDRILIVEDDDDLRIFIAEGLRRRGLDVETVSSGQACLQRIEQEGSEGFDVVVTDVQMPGMSGIELCRELSRRIPPMVTIVVTSMRDLTTRTAAFANGAFEFLTKPVKVVALEAAIRRAYAAAQGIDQTSLLPVLPVPALG